jgi:hypothetical protein
VRSGRASGSGSPAIPGFGSCCWWRFDHESECVCGVGGAPCAVPLPEDPLPAGAAAPFPLPDLSEVLPAPPAAESTAVRADVVEVLPLVLLVSDVEDVDPVLVVGCAVLGRWGSRAP